MKALSLYARHHRRRYHAAMQRSMTAVVASAVLAATVACARPPAAAVRPIELPTASAQLELREAWLTERHALLLPMMRRHDIDMWLVVTEEFHEDPLYRLIAPPRPLPSNRATFAFVDGGEEGLMRVAVPGFAEEHLARFFDCPDDPRAEAETLRGLIERYQPQRIALAIAGRRGVTRSLTHASYQHLVELLGEDVASRFVPATELIEDYLATRLPSELEPYRQMVRLTEQIGRRAFSNEVVTPGVTTVGDVRQWIYDEYWRRRVEPWFQPDIRVQRRGRPNPMSRGFLAVADEALVIEPGDLLHLDIGFDALGLATDWQKMAYVLRPGETEPPAGLQAELATTNRLQDVLCATARPGRTAGEVYTDTMSEMERLDIDAQIYSHPLGHHGHGMGTGIDFRAAEAAATDDDGQPEGSDRLARTLRPGAWMAIELNTKAPVADWEGQMVYFMLEDPAHLTPTGFEFFVPRQESFYLLEP